MADFNRQSQGAMNFWKQQENETAAKVKPNFVVPKKKLPVSPTPSRHHASSAPNTPTLSAASITSPKGSSRRISRIQNSFSSLRKKKDKDSKASSCEKDLTKDRQSKLAEKEAKKQEKEAKEKAEKEAKKLEKEEREKIERAERVEREAKEKADREAKRLEREEKEAKEKEEREAKKLEKSKLKPAEFIRQTSNSENADSDVDFDSISVSGPIPATASSGGTVSAPIPSSSAGAHPLGQGSTGAPEDSDAEKRKWFNKYQQSSTQVDQLVMIAPPPKPQKPTFLSKDQRENIVHELHVTEIDYVEDLSIIVELFLVPLRESKLISSEDLTKMFSTVELLLPLHREFMKQLSLSPCVCAILKTTPNPNFSVGQCFVTMSQYLKMYNQYCSNQQIATKTLDHLMKTNSEFVEFLDYTMLKPECRMLDLASFLIKPMQRVCKYPLLLRELQRNTDPSHVDYANITKAFELISGTVSIINDRKRQFEEAEELLALQRKLTYPRKFSVNEQPIMAPGRKLLHKGQCMFVSKDYKQSSVKWYLCNDILLVTKRAVLKEYIPIRSALVGHVNIEGVEHAFEIIHAGQSKLWLAFKEKAERDNLRQLLAATGMIDRKEEEPVYSKLHEYSSRPIPLPPGVDYTTALGIKSMRETVAVPSEFSALISQGRTRASTTNGYPSSSSPKTLPPIPPKPLPTRPV